ncbi:MAG: FeoB small GTPase domain-containing protein, partial [Oscillospiraceae bacterium]
MDIRIALAGNPNCGKTTLFNTLTGSNQYVGNWPGVTVEKKEGKLKGHKDVIWSRSFEVCWKYCIN